MKKGFTLIELLAVIIILAIIALIATPIILNIINDTKKESLVRSAENYISGVEQAILKENLNEEFNPINCNINANGNLNCDGYSKEIKVDVDGLKPTGGKIIFDNGRVVKVENLKIDKTTLSTDESGKFVEKEVESTYTVTLIDQELGKQKLYNVNAGEIFQYTGELDRTNECGNIKSLLVITTDSSCYNWYEGEPINNNTTLYACTWEETVPGECGTEPPEENPIESDE